MAEVLPGRRPPRTIKNCRAKGLEVILKKVAEKTGFSVEQIKGKSRQRELVKARRIYVLNAVKTQDYGYVEIAALINCDHSTINHHIRKAGEDILVYHEQEKYNLG